MQQVKLYHPAYSRTLQDSRNSHTATINDCRRRISAQAKLIRQIQQKPQQDEETKLENIKPDKIRPMQLKLPRKTPISPPQQTAQLTRIDIATGGPYEYAIDWLALGSGTGTTPFTRAAVNAQGNPPNSFHFLYAIYNTAADTMADANRQAWGTAIVPNPPIPGTPWDAGHALARQNGGWGHTPAHVFPQNRNVNRGWNGTFGLWRQHEVNFNAGVAAHGFGRWRIW